LLGTNFIRLVVISEIFSRGKLPRRVNVRDWIIGTNTLRVLTLSYYFLPKTERSVFVYRNRYPKFSSHVAETRVRVEIVISSVPFKGSGVLRPG